MKKCKDCRVEFTPTGKGVRCLECRNVWEAAWRIRRRLSGMPVISTRMPTEYHKKYNEIYYSKPEVKIRRAAIMREYITHQNVRPKVRARMEVRNAIRRGEISRGSCENCGAIKSQAHHVDYSKPLDVVWLCPMHHREIHAKAEGRA